MNAEPQKIYNLPFRIVYRPFNLILVFIISALVLIVSPGGVTAKAELQATSGFAQTQTGQGIINGKLLNGTSGASLPPARQIIKLERVDAKGNSLGKWQTTTTTNGSFQFQGLPLAENSSYLVSTRYAEVDYYFQNDLKLSTSQPTYSLELKIYETTNDPAPVSIAGTSLVIPQIDSASGQIFILEMYSILNKSDRTFSGQPLNQPNSLSKTLNPSERNTTLRFFLPVGATGITPASAINPEDIVETTDGIEVKTPVLPGENQFVFSYQLSYQTEKFTFTKLFAYDTPAFRLFVPLDGPPATSPQLRAGSPVKMGNQQLTTLNGQNFKANALVQIELNNLPLPPSKGVLSFRDTLLKISLIGIMLAGFIYLFIYVKLKYKLEASNKPVLKEQLDLERRKLLQALARMELKFETGEYQGARAEYEAKRATWKNRLVEIWAVSAETSQEEQTKVENSTTLEVPKYIEN